MAEFNEQWPDDLRRERLAGRVDDAYQLMRIPTEIWPALQSRLEVEIFFVVAWLHAVCATFPGHNLMELMQSKPGLFPAYLHARKRDGRIEHYLGLSKNGDLVLTEWQPIEDSREDVRATELAVLRACRFQQGYASAGMLCNEPPIPLRVLDFLEATDILRLSLACKSMYCAAHLLLKREEAVADSILAKLPKPWHPRFARYAPQRTLRSIRLGSLVHGTPEAVPIWNGEPVFPKCSTEDEPCNTSVLWKCDYRPRHSPMYSLTHSMWGLRSQIFEELYPQAFVLEVPQLRLVLTEIASQLADDVDHAPTLMAIEMVVRAAIRNGEPVLVRKWVFYDDF